MPLCEELLSTEIFGSPNRRGPKISWRKFSVESVYILVVVIFYLKTHCASNVVVSDIWIIINFGTSMGRLLFGILGNVLKDNDNGNFNVKWPGETSLKASTNNLINTRPSWRVTKGIFGVVYGGRLPCVDYYDSDIKNSYNGRYT